MKSLKYESILVYVVLFIFHVKEWVEAIKFPSVVSLSLLREVNDIKLALNYELANV